MLEGFAVITVQTVLGADPDEPGAVLEQGVDRQISETGIFRIKLEIFALRAQWN
jgi:hypothetical protein